MTNNMYHQSMSSLRPLNSNNNINMGGSNNSFNSEQQKSKLLSTGGRKAVARHTSNEKQK